ncbi:hypothetical protein FKM82_022855 [Ascaphus truei]
MSWNPFKAGPKKLVVSKTVERDFERENGKLQQLEDQTKKLQKEMKKSIEADLSMSKSAVRISSDLLANPLCEQDTAFLEMVTALDTAMKRMDAFNQEKVNQIQKTVMDPLKRFGSVFPSLNMAVKRREQALQEYKRLQSKVEKYEEKERTGAIIAKLHQVRAYYRCPLPQARFKLCICMCNVTHVPFPRPGMSCVRSGRTLRPRITSCWMRCRNSTTAA